MSDDQQRKKDKAEIKLFLKRLAIFVVAMVILFGFVFRIVVMPSDDMKPAIRIGDIELVYCLPSTKRVGQVVYYKEDGKNTRGGSSRGRKTRFRFRTKRCISTATRHPIHPFTMKRLRMKAM